MSALDGELGQTKKFAEPPPLSDHPRGIVDFLMLQLSKIDWRRSIIWLLAAIVLLGIVLGYAAWSHYRTTDPLKGLKPGIYQAPKSSSGEKLPLPAPPKH